MSNATITRLLTSARVQKLPLVTADKLALEDVDAWYQLVAKERRRIFEQRPKLNTETNWQVCTAYLSRVAREGSK